MTLLVRQAANDGSDFDAFCGLTELVYRKDPWYVRSARESLARSLQLGNDGARQQMFLVERHGTIVARAVARLPLSSERQCAWATIGHFESVDDPAAAAILLRESIQWLLAQGVERIIGPMEHNTWHRYRLNTGPFREAPFFMEPYNPAYYQSLWQQAGFEILENYHSKRLDKLVQVVDQFSSIHERALQRGYRLEAFNMHRFDDELIRLHRLSLTIFAENKLYTPITAEEFHQLYLPVKRIIDSRLVWFALSPSGDDVGFVFAIHDYQAAAAAMRGRLDLFAKLRFWANKQKAMAINVKSMGVVPGQRRSGIGIALVSQVYRQILAMGYRRANLCLIHDDNPSSRLDGGHGVLLRRYQLYQYTGNG